MSKITKVLVFTLAAVLISGTLFAQGSQDVEKRDDGKVEFRVSWWGATGRDEKYLKIIEEYESRNPDITIVPEYSGWADYWGKMATLVAAKNLPDVHQYTNNQLAEYAAKGAVISLEEYVADGTINLDDWNMGMVDSGRVDGELVSIPIGITAPALIVNLTWAEELGIDVFGFEEMLTWEEFADWLKNDVQPKMPAGTYAYGDYGTSENHWWTWVRQHGADWIDEDGNYAVPESVIEGFFAYIEDLRQAGVTPPLDFTMEDNTKARGDNAFNRRKVLIRNTNANQAKLEQAYMANEGDKVGMRRLPRQEGADTSAEALISSVIAISATSKVKDAAAEYINYFVNDETAQKIYNGEIGVPASYAVQEMLMADLSPIAAQEFEYINMVSQGAPPTEPKPEGIWAFDAEIQQMNQQVAAGRLTPAEAAELTVERADQFLKSLR